MNSASSFIILILTRMACKQSNGSAAADDSNALQFITSSGQRLELEFIRNRSPPVLNLACSDPREGINSSTKRSQCATIRTDCRQLGLIDYRFVLLPSSVSLHDDTFTRHLAPNCTLQIGTTEVIRINSNQRAQDKKGIISTTSSRNSRMEGMVHLSIYNRSHSEDLSLWLQSLAAVLHFIPFLRVLLSSFRAHHPCPYL